ncbi:hypothetical protein E2P86_08760 [Sphingobacterium psychroaquaticum]|uniref:DsrE family protein n=1 Tax=Sphingobacterium psychroaquaticum TaxID=561061 RepID=UPI00106B942D|nr:DsrE family protein [Sphingobacterium psychroaquaticum]QBQ41243.1 hypothetical protein E2P86_08760 [Sphingobacterium psychroaquaticum]
MKKIMLIAAIVSGSYAIQAQEVSLETLTKNAAFTGAVATKSTYKAIYQLDSNNPDVVKKAFRNIRNVLGDPRLKGKLEIELITFSGGTEVMLKTSVYEKDIKDLIGKGVQVSQCTNSLAERNLTKDQIYPFVAFVPSGNGELVIRASEGWVIVKP